MQRISRRAALLGLVGAALAACSKKPTPVPAPAPNGSLPPATTPAPTPTPKPSPTLPVDRRPRWPLNGHLLHDKSAARHAAVAVKVPDNKVEHPQRGIDKADIVFVELDGYRDASGHSGTRLMPVFHSRMADTVEPVRSVRPVDIPLLSPMDAIIGNTGGSPWVIAYAKKWRKNVEASLSYLKTYGSGSYGTDQSRVYHFNGNVYFDRATTCHPKVLAKQTKRFRAGPPRAYFPWASNAAQVSAAKGKRGRSVKIPYKGQTYFMGYRYDKKSKRYLRSMPWGPHVLADGTRVSTDNVLIILSKQHYGKDFHGAGGVEPLYDIIKAKGTFHYFNRGRYVTGTWSKQWRAAPFTFTLPDGSPFRMAAGQTYVELPNSKAKIRIKA